MLVIERHKSCSVVLIKSVCVCEMKGGGKGYCN